MNKNKSMRLRYTVINKCSKCRIQSANDNAVARETAAHPATSLASRSSWAISRGPCWVRSELRRQTFSVPSMLPTASRPVWVALKARHVAAAPPALCPMVAAGRTDVRPRSKICTTPGGHRRGTSRKTHGV